jgi:hypothetical protein
LAATRIDPEKRRCDMFIGRLIRHQLAGTGSLRVAQLRNLTGVR